MEEPSKKRDIYEKIGLILQSSGGLLTAVTVAVIGLIGSGYLKDQEYRVTRDRIYIELTSKREEAESALRKDMFVSIIQSFLRPGASGMDERILNLELLAYNFHESLNLKPLFLYLERQIGHSPDASKKEYMDRLFKVSSEISRKQLLVLESAGQKIDRDIFLDDLKQNPGGLRLEDATLVLEGVKRQFSLFVLDADSKTQQLKLRMEIKTQAKGSAGVETNTAEFWVGYFDFPMIDNTRLTNDQRAAVVLNAFEDGAASITLAYFPGSYASLKDKASLQEVLQNMLKADGKQQPTP
jgi:hypothetical protein